MSGRRLPPNPPARSLAPNRPLRDRIQTTLLEPATPLAPPPSSSGEIGALKTPISVSELTERLSRQLALGFSSVCVMGEISKVTLVASGHTYFTLKDAGATLDAMVWADRKAGLAVEPRQGLKVVAQGSLRVFPPSGRYSLHVDVLEPLGAGDLQRALDALKARLLAEGLFAEPRKRKLPVFLATVGLVTSPTGAVRHDIERTLAKGGARVRVLLSPTRVQGGGSALEIATAIRLLALRDDVDLIIVARGGGSPEELWSFNEEVVARAIAESRPPVISAVGHETDFTIADLVADVRAATPSVAAGLVVEIQRQALQRTETATADLHRRIQALRERWRLRLNTVSTHRVMDRERTRLERLRGRLSEAFARARVGLERRQALRLSTFRDLATRCEAQAPTAIFGRAHARVDRALLSMGALLGSQMEGRRSRAGRAFESRALRNANARLATISARFTGEVQLLARQGRPLIDLRRARLVGAVARLDALSPLAVLSRGYALATTEDGRILRDANGVSAGDLVTVRLSRGRLKTTVLGVEEEA